MLTVLVVAGTIHFTSLSRPYLTVGESLFRDVLAPLQFVVTRVHVSVESTVSDLKHFREIHQKNVALEAHVVFLEQQLVSLAEYRRENQWLREALDFYEAVDHELVVAEVIGRAPSNWLSSVTINRGKRHGVEVGMAVVSGSGIVGTVQSVTFSTANVVLAIDPQSAVGGLLQASGDLILVEGDPEYSRRLMGRPLSNDARPEVGDVVVTSGLSTSFPKGLPIGVVEAVIPGVYELTVTTIIRPFVDFARMEYVFVVVEKERE